MSQKEAGFTSATLDEGNSYLESLKAAFKTSTETKARIATTESGTYCYWWLRSPYNSSNVAVIDDGGYSNGRKSSYDQAYIRPVLSFDPTLLVDISSTIPTIIGK